MGKVSVFVMASTVLVPAGCPSQKPCVVVFLDATNLILLSNYGQSCLYLTRSFSVATNLLCHSIMKKMIFKVMLCGEFV